jgi:DNA mismatch endonuclease (patch repair protein)
MLRQKRLDPLSPAERSARMALIRSKNSKPELVVRKAIWKMGHRYRLHGKRLPGRPDLVFPAKNKVIFLHGCFWHLHSPCTHYQLPRTRTKFWGKKLEGNRARDEINLKNLRALGWDVFVVWECELKNMSELLQRIAAFLNYR